MLAPNSPPVCSVGRRSGGWFGRESWLPIDMCHVRQTREIVTGGTIESDDKTDKRVKNVEVTVPRIRTRLQKSPQAYYH